MEGYENFNCCLCEQEWQKKAGYANKNGNNLCYECIVECAGWVLGGKDKLREVMFGKVTPQLRAVKQFASDSKGLPD